MIRFLADENRNRNILRGLLRRQHVDVVRAQDVGLAGCADQEILEWAAVAGRVVLSHDLNTLPGLAWARVINASRMPGLILVPLGVPVGQVLEDLLLVANVCEPADVENQVWYLPL